MKRAFSFLVFIACFTASTACWADNSVWSNFELKDWTESSTGTTTQLSNSCEILAEARLGGNDLTNYVFLGLKNISKDALYIKLSEAHLVFSNGLDRSPITRADLVKLNENIMEDVWLVLPEKTDFRNADWLDLELPVFAKDQTPMNCSIKMRFTRDTNKPALAKSSTAYTVFDMDLGIGAALYRGNLSNIGGKTATGELGFSFFPWIENGFFLEFLFDGFSSQNYSLVSQAVGSPIDTSQSILGLGFFGGYSRRDYLSDKWALSWKVGPGLYSLNYTKSGSSNSDSSTSFAGFGEVGIDYRLSQVSNGLFRGAYSFGIAAYDAWIPSGKLNGAVDLSGQDMGLLARFKLGF